MIHQTHLHALRIVFLRLLACRSAWAITGSMGMALQGMDLEVHDIDLQTDRQGAFEIESLLKEYVVEPVHLKSSERIRSDFGTLEIDGVQVEVMGDIQTSLDGLAWEGPICIEDYRQWVTHDGIKVPVLVLDYEVQAYRRMGRTNRAEQIEKFIEERHP